jgi:hypothetical protein
MKERGIEELDSIEDERCGAVLVIGEQKTSARFSKQDGKKSSDCSTALNGMNWIHRKLRVAPDYYVRCEINIFFCDLFVKIWPTGLFIKASLPASGGSGLREQPGSFFRCL